MNKKLCVSRSLVFVIPLVFSILIFLLLISQKTISTKQTVTTRAAEGQEKIKLPPRQREQIKELRLMYKGKEIDTSRLIKGEIISNYAKSHGASQIDVGPIFIEKSLYYVYKDHIHDYILHSWNDERINKKINISDKNIYSFDGTAITDCSIYPSSSGQRIYFPNEYCQAFEKVGYPIGIQAMEGGGMLPEKYIYANLDPNPLGHDHNLLCYSNGTSVSYVVLTHELGHALGAIDSDYVAIAPNDKFPEGNVRGDSDPMVDIMYSSCSYKKNISDFTVYSINSTKPYELLDFYSNWQNKIYAEEIKDNNVIASLFVKDTYEIYGGDSISNHKNGTITDNPICTGELNQNREIDLKNDCKEFYDDYSDVRRTAYVAGFIRIFHGKDVYRGKFDFIDMIMSKAKEEKYHKVPLAKHVSSKYLSKIDQIPTIDPLVNPTSPVYIELMSENDLKKMLMIVGHIPYFNLKDWALSICRNGQTLQDISCTDVAKGTDYIDKNDTVKTSFPPEFNELNEIIIAKLRARYGSPFLKDLKTIEVSDESLFLTMPIISSTKFVNGEYIIIYGVNFKRDTNDNPKVFIDGRESTANIIQASDGDIKLTRDKSILSSVEHTIVVRRGKKDSSIFLYSPPKN